MGLLFRAALAVFVAPMMAHAAPPLEVYGNDAETSDLRISADGSQIAELVTVPDFRGIIFTDLATGKRRGTEVGNIKVRGIEWSGPNHLLLYVSETTNIMEFRSSKVEFNAVFSIDTREQRKPVQLLGSSRKLALQSSLSDVRAHVGNDEGDVLMAARIDRGGKIIGTNDLLRVSGTSGRGDVISRGGESTDYWVVSPKGHVIARVDHLDRSNHYRILVPTDEERRGGWKEVFSETTEFPNISVYGATTDESGLIVGTTQASGRYALFKMSLADGKIGDALFEHELVDVDSAIKDPHTGAVVGARYILNGPTQIFFENDLQGVLVVTQKAMPGFDVSIQSWDRNRKKFIVYSEGNGTAGTYHLLDLDKRTMNAIAARRPALKAADIAPVKTFFYEARDKLPIHAFLTTPPGVADPKNMPLVVLPHGGPASRDSTSFDYWAQFLASRGYAVLQMNFRGSDGYGVGFRDLGDKEWGGKMQDDVTDGVKYAIEKGIADPTRICIVGASYGGYAAMAGAVFTPDLYKCAVSIAGVTDLAVKMAWVRKRYGIDSSTYEYWEDTMGGFEDAKLLRDRSPRNFAQNVKADVLLLHGVDDTVVAFEQSELMADALKKASKNVQLVKLDGEDHWLSTAKTRTQMLRAMEGFLAKHLQP